MSNLIPLQYQKNGSMAMDSSCKSCKREFEKSIELTNLSAMPLETYNACPFCFTKLSEASKKETRSIELDTLKLAEEMLSPEPMVKDGAVEVKDDASDSVDCPYHLGYLKKRPKSTPIPDTCLTCPKMINCVL